MRPELGQDSAPVAVVVEVCQQVEGFRNPAEFSHRATQRGWPTAALQDSKKLERFHCAHGNVSGDAKEIIPVRDDQAVLI